VDGSLLVILVIAAAVFAFVSVSSKSKPQTESEPAEEEHSSEAKQWCEEVVGISHKNADGTSRQKIIQELSEGDQVIFKREYDNEHDPNAIAVLTDDGKQIGYIGWLRAEQLAPQMEAGYLIQATVGFIENPADYDDSDIDPTDEDAWMLKHKYFKVILDMKRQPPADDEEAASN